MPAGKTKVGVLLPTRGLLLGESPPKSADRILDLATQVEDAGLDSVWVGDSLTAKPRLEPLATLAAVAARTQRVRLGTAVLLAGLRHPLLLAQTIATIDLISRGRLVLAVGVGGAFNEGQKREWGAAGVIESRRARRLEEIVRIVKELGRPGAVTFKGKEFELDSVSMEPRPVQVGGVPVLLACHRRAAREAQLRRAARLGDGLISISDSPEGYSQVVQRVRGMAAELGRDPDRLEAVMYLTVNVDPDISRAQAEAEKFLMAYYGTNIWGTSWGPFGSPEEVKRRLGEYISAGAQTLVVRFASFEQERQLETFMLKVAPALD